MKRLFPFLCLALLGHSELCSQPQFISYTDKNSINDIAFHSDTIWLATLGGVVKCDFEGNRLASYTTEHGLANNWVTSVAIDSKGNKWFGTIE